MPGMRMMIDTVAALSESGRQMRSRYCFQPMMQPGEMKRTFVEQGLAEVTETELMIRMDYADFDDYWAPIAAGEGPLGKYMTTLDPAERTRTEAAVRDASQAGRPDGPRSFANVAWACRGVVRKRRFPAKYLFLRNSGRKTAAHFSWNCSSRRPSA